MERESVLKFTYEFYNKIDVIRILKEIGYNNLAFLDIDIKIHEETFQSSVHIKPTNSGNLLDYLSECPDTYKKVS